MKTLKFVAAGFFMVIGVFIVFVKAGTTGTSGGQQTALIAGGFGNGLATVAKALEGN